MGVKNVVLVVDTTREREVKAKSSSDFGIRLLFFPSVCHIVMYLLVARKDNLNLILLFFLYFSTTVIYNKLIQIFFCSIFLSESNCIMVDGMIDSTFIPNFNIKLSSNQEQVNAIRPGGKGWTPDENDKKTSITINTPNALVYGGSIFLQKAKDVGKFDVTLVSGKNVKSIKVININLYYYLCIF